MFLHFPCFFFGFVAWQYKLCVSGGCRSWLVSIYSNFKVLSCFYAFAWRCHYLNRPPTLNSNIFIAYETLTMAPLWLHVIWLVVGRLIFNPCVSLPPWKVTCQWNTCDLFKSFKFYYKIFQCWFNKKKQWRFWIKACHHQKLTKPMLLSQSKSFKFLDSQIALG